MTVPTLKRHSKRLPAPTGEDREEPVHDREVHAEGHFPRRLIVVRCWPAATYLSKNLSYQIKRAYLQFFSYSGGQILERTWKILRLSLSPGENTSQWCLRLVVPGFSQGLVRTILLFSGRPHQAYRPSGGSPFWAVRPLKSVDLHDVQPNESKPTRFPSEGVPINVLARGKRIVAN